MKINKWMTCMLVTTLMLSIIPTVAIKAQAATSGLEIVKLNTTALDREYPLDFEQGE